MPWERKPKEIFGHGSQAYKVWVRASGLTECNFSEVIKFPDNKIANLKNDIKVYFSYKKLDLTSATGFLKKTTIAEPAPWKMDKEIKTSKQKYTETSISSHSLTGTELLEQLKSRWWDSVDRLMWNLLPYMKALLLKKKRPAKIKINYFYIISTLINNWFYKQKKYFGLFLCLVIIFWQKAYLCHCYLKGFRGIHAFF